MLEAVRLDWAIFEAFWPQMLLGSKVAKYLGFLGHLKYGIC